MELIIRDVEGNQLVEVRAKYLGIVTPEESKDLRKRLLDLSEKLAVSKLVGLDLQHIEYMNSSGLGALVDISAILRNAGSDCVLYNLKDAVSKVIHMMGLDRIFNIVENEKTFLVMIATGWKRNTANDPKIREPKRDTAQLDIID